MKITPSFILLASLLWSGACAGQVYVDGSEIDTLNTPFCQLICTNAGGLTRTRILIDYGQSYFFNGLNRQKIAGPDQRAITFNSSIDALNFMTRNGWELVSSQVTGTETGLAGQFIYVLRRKTSARR